MMLGDTSESRASFIFKAYRAYNMAFTHRAHANSFQYGKNVVKRKSVKWNTHFNVYVIQGFPKNLTLIAPPFLDLM